VACCAVNRSFHFVDVIGVRIIATTPASSNGDNKDIIDDDVQKMIGKGDDKDEL
jgi:hypothetical protein